MLANWRSPFGPSVVVLKDGRTLTEFNTAEFPDAHSAAQYQDVAGTLSAGVSP